ncbi:MAG TPA: phosphoenolpyruvate synthase [Roseiflexaceae bacterium]|nr:phosphoenolpyruvate synthase [Roseiflexaceae bacterium]
MEWVRWFGEIGIADVPLVGGKNASLGEMLHELGPLGIHVPDGYAVTAEGYRYFLKVNALVEPIRKLLDGWTRGDTQELAACSKRIRSLILKGRYPADLEAEIVEGYRELSRWCGADELDVAVRSSATAEDLPNASFAGQQESFLHVHGEAELLESIKKSFASLFTARAINYREDMGFDHFKVALSVGVQQMVHADSASSGVMFTLDTETGFREVVFVTSTWGLGENIVQGRVAPDEFYVHKPTLRQGYAPIVGKRIGSKEFKLIYDESGHRVKNVPVPAADRARSSVSDEDVLQLARWALTIEEHYSKQHGADTPMDIEWAKDGRTGQLYIVQARPETVHSQKHGTALRLYHLREAGTPLVEGLAVGEAIAAGPARAIRDPREMNQFQPGEVLITEITNPDWEPIMKQAAAIVTERGGRTSHAAIVARELGIPAIVGAAGAIDAIATGRSITISCAEGEVGRVYDRALRYDVEEIDPTTLPRTHTQIMMNVGNPEQAFKLAQIPNDGVGLARMEFIFAGWVRVHPLALTRYDSLPIVIKREVDKLTSGYADKAEYFVDTLARGIATIAAAFWPKPVILRFSDFKTNEYAHLLGGAQFEPHEENPMLGWRGASRYYHPDYKEGFMLELAAVRRVRDVFGLKNLKLMVPFCRTVEEGRRVLEVMQEGGLVRGADGVEVYVMAEIPANVLLAEQFAELFDGFSIGSNDLTQFTLGVDRDSEVVAPLFDERNGAVTRACAELLATAHRCGAKVGICGQAPSDYPEFAAFLVAQGIDSISLSADAVVRTLLQVRDMEAELAPAAA